MRKLNLKKIIAMGLITTSILAVSSTGASASWKKDGTGWWYQNDNGVGYKVGWMQQNGYWYYFENSGYMKTGWLNDNGTWYYFKGDGSMVTANGIVDGVMNKFSNTGAWLGTATTSNISSNSSTLSAMDKINKNYENNFKNMFKKNDEYVLSDSEFTKDVAVKLVTGKQATECAGYVGYQDASSLYDTTFGGYNGLAAETSTIDVDQEDSSLDGSVNHYKVWIVGIIDKHSGYYMGSFKVFNNGFYIYYNAGSYELENPNFKEKTFDKNHKVWNNGGLN
jgi:hypothetical protein